MNEGWAIFSTDCIDGDQHSTNPTFSYSFIDNTITLSNSARMCFFEWVMDQNVDAIEIRICSLKRDHM